MKARPLTTQERLTVIAAVLLIWGLPYFAKTSWADIWVELQRVPLSYAVGFQALMLAGLWCYTFVLTGALRGITHIKALVLNLCGSSVSNLLPAGGAVGLAATFAICRSWGFTRRATSTTVIVTGVWNALARIALPVIARLASRDPGRASRPVAPRGPSRAPSSRWTGCRRAAPHATVQSRGRGVLDAPPSRA